jgi:hypothetical protein
MACGIFCDASWAQVVVRADYRPAVARSDLVLAGIPLPPSPDEVGRLLAMIPADHPLRDDLRLIAMQAPPDGFSGEAWLALAMRFNFRSGVVRHPSSTTGLLAVNSPE